MDTAKIRKELHQHIDVLPDEIIEQIADFTLFILARKQKSLSYTEWEASQWQELTLEQFFRDDDDVEYTLADAQEIYRP